MKRLYLLMKQYSRFYFREIVLLAQLILLVILFSPIIASMVRLTAFQQLADKLESPAVFFQVDDYFMMPEFIDPKLLEDHFQEISKCPGVMGVGQTALAVCNIRETDVHVFFYNDALVRNMRPMFERWPEKSDLIPVVIDHALGRRYKVGDIINSETPLFFPVSAKKMDAKFIVIGVLDKASNYYYSFMGGASEPLLESIGTAHNEPAMIAVGSFEAVPAQDVSPSCLLFVQKADADTIENINANLGRHGHAERIDEMRNNTMHHVLLQNPLPFVTALLMLLLSLSTVFSYTYINGVQFRKKLFIYYLHGAGIKRLIRIAIFALVQLFVICSAVSYVAACFFLQDTDMIGVFYTLLIVLIIFAASILMMLFQYKRINPTDWLRTID